TSGPPVTGPVETSADVRASTPVTVAVRSTSPGTAPVNVHVKVRAAPGASDPPSAGDGPALRVAVPVPPGDQAAAPRALTVVPPLFVTVSMTRNVCPVFRGEGPTA